MLQYGAMLKSIKGMECEAKAGITFLRFVLTKTTMLMIDTTMIKIEISIF